MRVEHAFFRYPLLLYCLFTLAQFATGTALYVTKIGLSPAEALEFYQGSEAMLAAHPGAPDRFMQAKTFEGLVKVALGHMLFFAFTGFLCLHLIRSLAASGNAAPGWLGRAGRIDRLSAAYFGAAGLDLAAGFFVRYGPAWLAYARFWIFALFTLVGSGLVALLALLLLRSAPTQERAE